MVRQPSVFITIGFNEFVRWLFQCVVDRKSVCSGGLYWLLSSNLKAVSMTLDSDANTQYRRLFEAAYDGILLINFETGEIEDVNPYLIQMLGYPKSELIGKQLWEIGAIVDRDASVEAFAALKRDRYIKYDDLPLKTQGGDLIHVEFVSNVYDVGGQNVIQCNIRDISSRLEVEALRLEADALRLESQRASAKSMIQIVDALTKVVVARDPYTYQHQHRVADLCVALAVELKLSDEFIEGLNLIAQIHDIGKVSVPIEILTKPTELQPYEFDLLRAHAQAGSEIVKHVDSSWPIAEAIVQHHERLDGSGYPNQLKGDSIVLEARIIAVADTVEAMSTDRPYRKAPGLKAGLSAIEEGRDRLFDGAVVDACLRLFKQRDYAFPNAP